jgi:hypothetical protein
VQKICPKMFKFLNKWRYDRILHAFCINPRRGSADCIRARRTQGTCFQRPDT